MSSSKIADFFPRSKSSSIAFTSSSGEQIQRQESTSSVVSKLFRTTASPMRRVFSSSKALDRLAQTTASDNDYVCQAAQFISTAQKSEAEGQYDLAFSCYKSGINILLQGVQDDADLSRRNAVRRKTAKYLVLAERIYQTYLAHDKTDESPGRSWAEDIGRCIRDPSTIGLQASVADLRQLNVLRRLSRTCLFVKDQTGVEYVVKISRKTVYPERSASAVAVGSPGLVYASSKHLIGLLKFFDCEHCIIWQLEYAAGGRLWDRLHGYFKARRELLTSFITLFEDDVATTDSVNTSAQSSTLNDSLDEPVTHEIVVSSPSGKTAPVSFDDIVSSIKTSISEFSISDQLASDEATDSAAEQEHFADFQQRSSLLETNSATSSTHNLNAASSENSRPASPKPIMFAACSSSRNESPCPMRRNESISHEQCALEFSLWLKQSPVQSSLDLPERFMKLILASILTALSSIHGEAYLARTLQPKHILIDGSCLKLSYFFEWSLLDRPSVLDAARRMYAAPETRRVCAQLSEGSDWFCFGSLAYELLVGVPLRSVNPHGISRAASVCVPTPVDLSVESTDLLKRLLCYDHDKRLGAGPLGADEIRAHPFFDGIVWQKFT